MVDALGAKPTPAWWSVEASERQSRCWSCSLKRDQSHPPARPAGWHRLQHEPDGQRRRRPTGLGRRLIAGAMGFSALE